MKRNVAFLTVLSTATLMGATAYSVTQYILSDIGPLTLAFMRFLLGGGALLLFCPRRELSLELFRASFWTGASLGLAIVTMLLGLRSSLTGVAAFLVCGDAFLIPIVDHIFFGNRVSRMTIVGLSIGAAGIAFLTIDSAISISHSDIWLLLSAFLFALYCACMGHVVTKFRPELVSCASHVIGAVVVGAFALPLEGFQFDPTPSALFGVLYFGLIISGLRFTLLAHAQTALSASELGLASLIEPVTAALVGVLVLGERMRSTQWLGAFLVLAGVATPIIFRRGAQLELPTVEEAPTRLK